MLVIKILCKIKEKNPFSSGVIRGSYSSSALASRNSLCTAFLALNITFQRGQHRFQPPRLRHLHLNCT
jgi:hypothetical protein